MHIMSHVDLFSLQRALFLSGVIDNVMSFPLFVAVML